MTNTYDDIDNTLLRTFNRCVTAFNIKEDSGEEAMEKYFNSIDGRGQKQMLIVFKAIELKGLEAVKREVMQEVK
tara:strand:- start:5989 stop:6210 length:222 start_codon:yes stop_codon:yes gene_type:complete